MPDAHSLIEKLPHPKAGWVLKGFSGAYCGPTNPLDQQLDENDNPKPGQEPEHALDEVCLWHDKMYRDFPEEKHRWDKEMLRRIDNLGPSSGWKESVARKLVKGIIWGKVKLGLGVGGCVNDSDDEDERMRKRVIVLHAPSQELGRMLKENGIKKVD
jgi:hypothetical protein